MIHFNLNIDLFYDFELKINSEIKAIACIEYPILHIIAKTIETLEEEYDTLDRFIVETAFKYHGFSINQFSELTGLGTGVFEFRAKELLKQQYISEDDHVIFPIDQGMRFLNDPTFVREIEKTRSFLLDGVTHQPLKTYFYKDGKDNLISEEEKDSYGNKVFNPAIIHNPPSKNIQQLILNIPIESRSLFNIPVGLKEITDFDFILLTYPVSIVLTRNKAGQTLKRLIDVNGFYADEECLSNWQKSLDTEIKKTEIIIEEKDVHRNEHITKKTQFKNNWGRTRTSDENRIFNLTIDKLKYFIQKLFNLQLIEPNNVFFNDYEIQLKIDRKLFESEGADKKKLMESCLRKRDYYRQYEGIGVWLVFMEVIIADDYIQGLVDLYSLLKEEIPLKTLISMYINDYKVLRQNLIAIERLDKLEELDVFLFLHQRETSFKQTYLILENE